MVAAAMREREKESEMERTVASNAYTTRNVTMRERERERMILAHTPYPVYSKPIIR
jgi:hypothetical protein